MFDAKLLRSHRSKNGKLSLLRAVRVQEVKNTLVMYEATTPSPANCESAPDADKYIQTIASDSSHGELHS